VPNIAFHDNKNNQGDPATVLAGMAAQHAAEMMEHSILERGPGGALLTDPELDEAIITELAWGALCRSKGIPESYSDQIAWFLYKRGALESGVIEYELHGRVASYAWPEQRVALMTLETTVSNCKRYSAEELAECTYYEVWRDAVFLENGWTMVKVDPDSHRLDEQLGQIAALLRASGVEVLEQGTAS
jgi:hypothetical protein